MDFKNTLYSYGQEHLLENWNNLSEEQQLTLKRDVESQDFKLLQRLFQEHSSKPSTSTEDEILPLTFDLAENNIRHSMWEETGFLLL